MTISADCQLCRLISCTVLGCGETYHRNSDNNVNTFCCKKMGTVMLNERFVNTLEDFHHIVGHNFPSGLAFGKVKRQRTTSSGSFPVYSGYP